MRPRRRSSIGLTGYRSVSRRHLDRATSRDTSSILPVTALLALAGGGYAVEVSDGATSHLVGVEPGLYADGYVEVTSDELREGQKVVVPA